MNALLTQLIAAVRAEKQKAGILGVLAVIALVMGIRAAFTTLGGSPTRSAQASAAKPASSAAANTARRGSNAPDGKLDLAAVLALVNAEHAPAPKSTNQVRDLFLLSSEHFPPPAQPEPALFDPAKSPGGIVEDAPEIDPAAQPARNAQQDAALLKLNSIMIGRRNIAIINASSLGAGSSVIVAEGDTVAGFAVTAIERDAVVVERDGVRVRLELKGPTN